MSRTAEASLPVSTSANPVEKHLLAYRWMLLARVLRGENRQPLSRRQDHRRRLSGQGAGSAQRVDRHLAAQGRCLCAAHPRPGGPARFRRSDPRLPRAPTWARASARCAGATAMSIAAGRAEGMLPMISHLCAMISVVNGALMARRFRGEKGAVGAVSIGEGATSTGAFHEALNQAAVEKLPLVLVVANNQYAYSTPTSRQFACDDLVDKAAGYGVQGYVGRWHRSRRVPARGRRRDRPRARRRRPAARRRLAAAARRPWRTRRRPLHRPGRSRNPPLGARLPRRSPKTAILQNGWASASALQEWCERARAGGGRSGRRPRCARRCPNPSEEDLVRALLAASGRRLFRRMITYLEAIREAQARALRPTTRASTFTARMSARSAAPSRPPRTSPRSFPAACSMRRSARTR